MQKTDAARDNKISSHVSCASYCQWNITTAQSMALLEDDKSLHKTLEELKVRVLVGSKWLLRVLIAKHLYGC
jgi:hypothetical protein